MKTKVKNNLTIWHDRARIDIYLARFGSFWRDAIFTRLERSLSSAIQFSAITSISATRNRVWGYILDGAALLQYGVRMNLGSADDVTEKKNTILRAGLDLLGRAGVSGHAKFTDATTTSGAAYYCFALARVTDDPRECFDKPSREMIENLKKVLKTDKEPRWYYW
ncbi:hypothetical protein C0995_003063 [Termitomyces sp. Mi166|nr:hypothetical protein C0995_003063 [Termitomyces sp. Mi166\